MRQGQKGDIHHLTFWVCLTICGGAIVLKQEGDLLMTGTPAGVGEMKVNDKINVKLTYPGVDGEVISNLDWDCVQRQGGFEFKG